MVIEIMGDIRIETSHSKVNEFTYLDTMRILSFIKFRNSVAISSWDSLKVAETSPIRVASTSGLSDISAIKELRSRGRVGGFQVPKI